MISFEKASAVERASEHEYVANIPDGWQQGRGAFGGLVLGTMMRAMAAAEGSDDRTARSLLGDLCGPVMPGPARIRTEILRRGKNQSNVRATLFQEDGILATTTAVFSTPRKAETAKRVHARPEVAPWTSIIPLPLAAPLAPVFAQHFQYRNTGPVPFTAGPEALAGGWVKPNLPIPRLDAPAVIALLDTWWPAYFSVQPMPRAVATISFAAELLLDASKLPPDEPLQHVARVDVVQEGFFVEFRELWTASGELVAMNQQTMAVLA